MIQRTKRYGRKRGIFSTDLTVGDSEAHPTAAAPADALEKNTHEFIFSRSEAQSPRRASRRGRSSADSIRE